MELQAMENIREAIARDWPHLSERLLPTQYLDAIIEEEAEQTIERLRARTKLGNQYARLFRAVSAAGLSAVELSIHRDDRAYEFVAPHAVPVAPSSPVRRLSETASPDLWIFRPFHFPILDWTKLEMLDHAADRGYAHVLDLTWFCHQPRFGKPCGACNPCRYTAAEGLAHRIPLSTRALVWLSR
jgi:hypothetical protein